MKRTSLTIPFLLALTASGIAFAQPTPAPTAPSDAPPPPAAVPSLAESLTGDAKADYESGKVLFGDGDHQGALVKFRSAYEKSKDARLLWNLAACEKNLRHYSRSLKLVRQYLTDGGDKLTAQDRSEAQDLIKVMEPFTAGLKVLVNEAGAQVFVDDEAVGTSPVQPQVVDIGSRKIRVHKDEYEDFAREVAVGGATEVTVDVTLVKIVHEGRLNVHATSEGSIAIDGKVVGAGSWSGVLPSGGHTLRVTAPKMRPYQAEVLLQDKENRDLNVTLDPEPSKGLPTWAWIAGGVVLAGGLTTAGYFIFKSDGSYEGPSGNLSPGVVQASRPIRF